MINHRTMKLLRPDVKDRFIKERHDHTTLSGGVLSSILSNYIVNSKINNAVKKVEESVSSSLPNDALLTLASEGDLVDKSLATFVQAYIDRWKQGGTAAQLSGNPLYNGSISGRAPTYYLTGCWSNPICSSSAPYATYMLSGGFLSGLKKVANKVANVVSKVADVPILGTALKAIPGVGNIISTADDVSKVVSKLTQDTRQTETNASQASQTQATPVDNAVIQESPTIKSNDETTAAQAAVNAINQLQETATSNSDVISPTAMADVLPSSMESVSQLRQAKMNGASLLKNASILGYALKGDPALSAASAASYVISISAIPAQSALAQGLTLDPSHGVWKVSDFTISLLPGITATDMTAALTILNSLSRMGSDGPRPSAEVSDPAQGSTIMPAALGAAYFAAAVPYLASIGDFGTLNAFNSSVVESITPEIASVISSHISEYSMPTPVIIANYLLVVIILTIRQHAGSATTNDTQLLSQIKTLGSAVLTESTAADIDALANLYPVPLSIANANVMIGSLWLTNDQDDEAVAQAYLAAPKTIELIDTMVNASQSTRAELMKQVPSQFTNLVRAIIDEYDMNGQTGVSKVLSSIGDYVKRTFQALIS